MVNHGIVTDERSRDVLTAMPEAEWRKRTGPLVYFIGPTGGLIKIGRTENLRARLSQLRSANIEHLHVWACTYGTNLDEANYHHWYAAHRIRGEWFARAPAIVAEIQRLGGVS